MNRSQGLERAKQGLRPTCNVPRWSMESRSQQGVSFAAPEHLPGGQICASQSSLASRGQESRDVLAAHTPGRLLHVRLVLPWGQLWLAFPAGWWKPSTLVMGIGAVFPPLLPRPRPSLRGLQVSQLQSSGGYVSDLRRQEGQAVVGRLAVRRGRNMVTELVVLEANVAGRGLLRSWLGASSVPPA